MAAYAWSQSPLGPSRLWPRSLKTAIEFVEPVAGQIAASLANAHA
jgi:hypothetical protein